MTVNTARTPKRQTYRIRRIRRGTPPENKDNGLTHNERLSLALFFVTGLGAAAGALCCPYVTNEVQAAITASEGGSLWEIFADSFIIAAVYILICFFGGFSSAGRPLAYFLCLFKGMGAGLLSAYIFGEGLMLTDTAAGVLPFEVIGTASVILAARENIRLSEVTAKRTFGKLGGENGQADIMLYLKKFGVIMLTAAAAAMVDALLS